MAAPIEFFFDFASPYGYLASTQVEDLSARTGRDVVWRPILLGAVFKVTGGNPNATRPLMGDYLQRDVARFARLLGVPLHKPMPLPFASLAAGRCFYWLAATDEGHARTFARVALDAHWAEGRNMAEPDEVVAIAHGLGHPKAEVQQALGDAAVKDRLKRATDEAIARGVFGSPCFIVDGEPFWGVDRMEQVERWARSGGW